MPRLMLTDDSWKLLSRIMYLTGRIYNKSEHRMTLEGILFRMRTGIPWRDLPEEFGDWNTVFRRFNLWSKKGLITEIFQFLSRLNDPQWLFIDGSIVKTHQDGANVKSPSEQAMGKSRGGNSTKIHLAVDSGGLPVYFELSGGKRTM
jgi:transposase